MGHGRRSAGCRGRIDLNRREDVEIVANLVTGMAIRGEMTKTWAWARSPRRTDEPQLFPCYDCLAAADVDLAMCAAVP
jgi:hypothetical protein